MRSEIDNQVNAHVGRQSGNKQGPNACFVVVRQRKEGVQKATQSECMTMAQGKKKKKDCHQKKL